MQNDKHGCAVSQHHVHYSLKEHDLVFWFGDLNYRIHVSLSVEEVFDHISNDKLHFLRLCSNITNTCIYAPVVQPAPKLLAYNSPPNPKHKCLLAIVQPVV